MKSCLFLLLSYHVFYAHCFSLDTSTQLHDISKAQKIFPESRGLSPPRIDNCDITLIPAMNKFDMNKFSGSWYELANTKSGYIDVTDGMWKIMPSNVSNDQFKFLFSGRDYNDHCIRPVPGSIDFSTTNPGEIILKYRTYSTAVSEKLRVLHTDYDSFAVLYKCVYIDINTGKCNPGGVYGAIWTRKSHVQHAIFDKGVCFLERACIERATLILRPTKGACDVTDLGKRDEMMLEPNFCYSPVSPGSCQDQLPRYYYNEYENKCTRFEFSGCGGNKNNFVTKTQCEETCKVLTSKDTNCKETAICALACPPCCREVDGCIVCSCETLIIDKFSNCFHDEHQCPEECEPEERYPGCYACICTEEPTPFGKEMSPICLETMNEGRCTGREERYYFNYFSRECEMFNYTGCQGSKNNFRTYEACQKECKVSGTEEDVQRANILKNENGGANEIFSKYTSLLVIFLSILWFRNWN